MKKYEFTGEVKLWFGHTLRQIRATVAFGEVEAGEIGGWIEKEENLSHEGNAWVCGDAQVFGDARVYDNARVCGDAQVYDNARVFGDAWVCGDAQVCGDMHFLTIGPIGSRGDVTTFFRTKELEIYVKCGCFRGSIQAFAEQVQKTHGENRHGREYMAAIELAKAHIDLTPEE